ncbi:hypothetical protein BBJ28_00024970 [Nothophytophthora sp. Chile5]|nr:hypothetical protein BBJ28_00024970 [Nothophytophthora sp. Chile5]
MTKLSLIVSFAAAAAVALNSVKAASFRADRTLAEAGLQPDDWMENLDDDPGSGDDGSQLGQFANVRAWDQCGGMNFDLARYMSGVVTLDATTKLTCEPGYGCEVVNPWFFQCQEIVDPYVVPRYGQCGGIGYEGETKCSQGYECVVSDPWYSLCRPKGTQKRTVSKKLAEADLWTESSGQYDQVDAWEQCGGKDFDYALFLDASVDEGDAPMLTCAPGYGCEVVNAWYFQCQPLPDLGGVAQWKQCGGADYEGATNCVTGSVCKYFSDWYSQCVPKEKEDA